MFTLGRKTTGPGEFRIGEDADNGSNYAGFTVGASLAGNTIYTLPTAFPSFNNSSLLSSTTGTTAWQPTVLDVETTQVGNVGTGEDQLYSYTLPASTMATDEQSVRLRFSGSFANNANSKTLRVKFGATTIFTRAITTPTITTSWTCDCEIIRLTNTTQKANCSFNGGDGLALATLSSPAETLSGTVAIVVTGEATSDDDIYKFTANVRFQP